jgi:hypothetical protein
MLHFQYISAPCTLFQMETVPAKTDLASFRLIEPAVKAPGYIYTSLVPPQSRSRCISQRKEYLIIIEASRHDCLRLGKCGVALLRFRALSVCFIGQAAVTFQHEADIDEDVIEDIL